MSNDEYQQKQYWDSDKLYLVLTEYMYDKILALTDSNCGYDINKVIIIRGYPKFDVNE